MPDLVGDDTVKPVMTRTKVFWAFSYTRTTEQNGAYLAFSCELYREGNTRINLAYHKSTTRLTTSPANHSIALPEADDPEQSSLYGLPGSLSPNKLQ